MSKGSLKTNFAINVMGAIGPLAISLITVPIYVRHIGDARYGVLSIVWVLLGYFGFLDLGLSRAAANVLAKLRHASQPERARVLVTTLVLNLGLGTIGSLFLAAIGSYLLQHVLAVPETLKPEIAEAFPWIVVLLPLALVSGVGVGALESREHFLLANSLQVSGVILGQIVPVILALLVGPSLAIIIPAAAAARGLTVVSILIAMYRQEGPLSVRLFDSREAKKLLSYGGWISVSGIISPLLSSLDQFLIGSVLSVAAVAHYAVPMNLVSRSQIFAGALTRTLFPRMSSVGPAEALQLASRSLLSLSYGYGAICAPAILLTPLFLRIWIGADFAALSTSVAQILFFGAWINGLAFVPYGLLQSQGRPDVTGKLHIAELLPFVVVLWTLTSLYGINGAAMAWSLRCAVDAACLFWAAGIPRADVVRTVIPPVLVMAASVVLSFLTNAEPLLTLISAAAVTILSGSLALAMAVDLRTSLFGITERCIRPIRRFVRLET